MNFHPPALRPAERVPLYPSPGRLVSVTNHWNDGLTVEFSTLNEELFAIQDGTASFIPMTNGVTASVQGTGDTYQVSGNFYAPDTGIVVLRSQSIFKGEALSRITIYHNVKLLEFKAAMRLQFDAADLRGEWLVPNKLLRKMWKREYGTFKAVDANRNEIPNQWPTEREYTDFYINQCAIGKAELAVKAGDLVGVAGIKIDNPNHSFMKMESGLRTNQSWQKESIYNKILVASSKYPAFEAHPFFLVVTHSAACWDAVVKFEVWDKKDGKRYVPLTDAIVHLYDHADLDGTRDRLVASSQSDSVTGLASFMINDINAYMSTLAEKRARFYFVINCPQNADFKGTGLRLPATWSTKAANTLHCWQATDGSDGFLNFGPDTLSFGTAAIPKVFRVGLEYHIAFKLDNKVDKEFGEAFTFLPNKINAALCTTRYNPTPPDCGTRYTTPADLASDGNRYAARPNHDRLAIGDLKYDKDRGTNFSGIVFDANGQPVQPGWNYFFELDKNLADADVNMLLTQGIVPWYAKTWSSSWEDQHRGLYDGWQKSTLGVYSNNGKGQDLIIKEVWNWFAFYSISVARELNEFYKYFTKNEWQGVSTDIFAHVADEAAFASPDPNKGNIVFGHFPTYWNRPTIAHEFTHVVHNRKYPNDDDYWGRAVQRLGGSSHHSSDFTNPYFAFTEGFAEFVEALFAGKFTPEANRGLTNHLDGGASNFHTSLTPIHNDPFSHGLGSNVEGAFALAMYDVFWEIIAKGVAPAGTKKLKQGNLGNLLSANTWMKADKQDKLSENFKRTFWDAFNQMDNDNEPRGISEIVQLVLRSIKPENIPAFLACMWRFNIVLPKLDLWGHVNDEAKYTDTEAYRATYHPDTETVSISGKFFAKSMESKHLSGEDTVSLEISTDQVESKDVKVRSHDLVTFKLKTMPTQRPATLYVSMKYKIRGVYFNVYGRNPLIVTIP